MNAIYVKLKDESGSYWNPSLKVRLVRSRPAKLTDIPLAKELIKKGVLVEIPKEEYDRFQVDVRKAQKESEQNKEEGEKVVLEKYTTSMDIAKSYAEKQDFVKAIKYAKQADFIMPGKADETMKFVIDCETKQKDLLDVEEKAQKEVDEAKDALIELVEKGLEKEVISKRGSWYKLGETTLGNGLDDTVEVLMTEEELLEKLKEALNDSDE